MRSLGFRIGVGVAAGQLVVLGLATLLGYRVASGVLTGQFDDALVERAEIVAGLLEQELHVVMIEPRMVEALPPPTGGARDDLQIWLDDGRCLYRSPSLEGADLPGFEGALGERAIADGPLPGGGVARVLSTRVEVQHIEREFWNRDQELEPQQVTLVLARDRGRLDQAQATLLTGLLTGDLLILLTAALIARLVARRGLVPLRRLGQSVQDLDVATLAGRFEPDQAPRELVPLIESLNDLRARVDDALRREKRLGATIAHEFRTPISELRALSQVALADPDDLVYSRRALEQVEAVSGRLGRLLDLIRRLSQLEQRDESLAREPLTLSALLHEERLGLQVPLDDRGTRIDLDGLEDVEVEANREALESVLHNLLTNAVEYSPEDSTVRCAATRGPEGVELRVENPCQDLGPELVTHLTEPFWRRSEARDDSRRHGLGLTIARGMAVLAGMALRFQVRDGRFVATLSIPEHTGSS